MDEGDGFEPRVSLRDGEPDRADVLLTEDGGRLRVELVITPYGRPRRWRRAPAVRLGPGEWVRCQINYRFSGYRGWSYRLDTLNLAYGPAAPDAFLHTPPLHVDQRAGLF